MLMGHLAIDLGASSGRVMLGVVHGDKIHLEEIHRFTNDPVTIEQHMYWDVLRLFHEIKVGLKKASHKEGIKIRTIGIDTWGVDGGWLDQEGRLLGQVSHYRDPRTEEVLEAFYTHVSDEVLYDTTGIQKMNFNTIYQLFYDQTKIPTIRDYGKKWLFVPDLLGYFLTGIMRNEYTIASTGALIDAHTKQYAQSLLHTVGLTEDEVGELIYPGEILGELHDHVAREVGLEDVLVVAVGSHDTASAVAGTPLQHENEAYLCCGTWCLLGVELNRPCITKEARHYNFTNEGGVNETIRFLKNINGLWFLQQLRKAWRDEGVEIDFPDMIAAARCSEVTYTIDANDQRFMAPFSMRDEIVKYCEERYGVTLSSIGDITKVAYNGLAQLYHEGIEQLEILTGKSITTIRMVGGGIQDTYLCQKVADVTGKEVIAGPKEASCVGNLLLQMQAVEIIKDLAEGRQLVLGSFEQIHYKKQ